LSATSPTQYHYKIIDQYPQSRDFFTQGLEYYQGVLYAGSGLKGKSKIIARHLNSITPLLSASLDEQYFGEGITHLNGKLYQLTWQSERGFVYQANNLQRLTTFKINGEGWGLCNNGEQLIYSNGSDRLRFVNPETFATEREIAVTLNGEPITHLNELEWVDGLIYANIWQTNWIIIINPSDGEVVGKVRLNDLLPQALRRTNTDVLNGIAYDHEQRRLLVTGKNWPRIYHIELIPDF